MNGTEIKTVETFPHAVRHIENLWIPMPDGIKLAARGWIPESAEDTPVPAIVEFIPYRKRDIKRDRDQRMHAYFAGHGYACLRIDMRGSGDSEGILEDEYLAREQQDGVALLSWAAEQPWCDGNVGMMGLSWGGFNGLQIAAHRPLPLKAVISLCSTDDRYADDVHYMGGCLLGDNLSWASNMFAKNACPPDPAIVGDRWREMWMERLEANRPWLITWLSHQFRDGYWKHASVCEDFSAINCPVMAVSGWADGYSNAVFRLMERLKVPRQALIGAWSHKYPHEGTPGPAIGFLQEALRWWDHWLKGIDTGIDKEPMLRVWMQDSAEPDTAPEFRSGRWIGERAWPSPRIQERAFPLAHGRLYSDDQTCGIGEQTIQSPISIGLFSGKWCSYAQGPDMPYDQREEDGGALVFDSDPLEHSLEILGSPRVELELASNRPVGMIAIRLSDVAPDDKATRVTYGLLNLCHRQSHEAPAPMTPGERFRVSIELNDVAHRFLAGHRFRLAISTSYWPLAWGPPQPVRLTVAHEPSRLILPVRPEQLEDLDMRPFDDPETAPGVKIARSEPARMNWRVIRDLARDESVLEVVNDQGAFRLQEIDLDLRVRAQEWYRCRGNNFRSFRGETRWLHEFKRGDWRILTETRTVLTCDATHFYVHATLDAYEGENRVFERSWNETLTRNLV